MKHLKILLLTIIFCNDITAQDISIVAYEKLPEIETYVTNEMKQRKIPGLVFGIFQNDKLLMCKAYGKADLQNQAPVIPETVFELSSITKQFTAAAILLLQQDGKLTIDAPLKKHFPQCPNSWSEITLKHLLTHTSGLTGPDDYPGINKMTGERVRKEFASWSKQFLIDALIAQELSNQPGEVYYYSDAGYALLGIVIDNISGSYRNFLNEKIF
ncbi:MAG TPA: serine hydrolase domain-containing protein, partial [Gillisia sp.]|nr:serine hydrolase domain-containing protein [Gillisia sp.]